MPNSPPKILVLGSINVDLMARVPRFPQPGETIDATSFLRSAGGKGANQAVAVARLGGLSTLVGRTGSDAYGAELIESLHSDGVDTTWIGIEDDCPTGLAMITVDALGENCITIVAGANARLSPKVVEEHEGLIAAASAILLQLEVPLETVEAAVLAAKKHRVLTILDPAPVPASGLPLSLQQVDVMTPNRTEAEQLTGRTAATIDDAMRAALTLHRGGAGRVLVTLGADGVIVCEKNSCEHLPACGDVTATDTTGAGDAFAGALTVRLAEGESLRDATRYASAAGAIAVTMNGAQSSLPTDADVKSKMQASIEAY